MTTGNDPATPARESMPLSRKLKIALWCVCITLAIVIACLNLQEVTLNILIVKIQVRIIALVLLSLALGFLIGLVTPGLWARRKKAA